MSEDEAERFRRELKRAPSRPASRSAGYVVGVVLAVFGVGTTLGAASGPMFWSGLIIASGGAVIAALTFRANTRWRP